MEIMRTNSFKSKSIKTKILAIALTVLLLSLGTVSAVSSILGLKGTEDTLYSGMQETSKTAAVAVANRLTATMASLGEIGTNPYLSSAEISLAKKLEILDSKVTKYKLISLDVADLKGNSLRGENVDGNDYFKEALGDKVYISSPEMEGSSQVIMVSAPVWENGVYGTNIVGVIYARMEASFLSGITAKIQLGETGGAYIIDEKGTTIAHKNQEFVASHNNNIEASKSDSGLAALASIEKVAVSGEPSKGQYTYGGITKIVCFTPIEGTSWSIGVNAEKSEFMASGYKAALVCGLISLLALIISAIVMIKFADNLVRPIKEVEEAAKNMAEGDYDIDLTYTSEDEIGNLANSMRTMITSTKDIIEDTARGLDKLATGYFDLVSDHEYPGIFKSLENSILQIASSLSGTMSTIRTSADQVSSGAEQVSSGAQILAQGTTEQASSIQELSASINEISDQIRFNAENAEKANSISSSVGQELEYSNSQMNKMMTSIRDIADKSSDIKKIIKVIEDIAFQTNILALNAAVEAARAGSSGKGFAVVADEVRNLAGKSAEAAKNTTVLIEDTVRVVSEGTAIATETARAIDSVVANAEQVVLAVTEITNASRNQANAISQITTGLDQISSVVNSNSATAEESAAASEELSGQASMLQEEVAKFTLKRESMF
ncbi:MAG: methyl-accepting chemotaxis protein [Proteocatella sp.]